MQCSTVGGWLSKKIQEWNTVWDIMEKIMDGRYGEWIASKPRRYKKHAKETLTS